jgi:hypothetical protein
MGLAARQTDRVWNVTSLRTVGGCVIAAAVPSIASATPVRNAPPRSRKSRGRDALPTPSLDHPAIGHERARGSVSTRLRWGAGMKSRLTDLLMLEAIVLVAAVLLANSM